MLALAVILPRVVHLVGAADLGRILLPIHIPVLLSGFIVGPAFGLAIGVLSPVLSYLLSGMPAPDRLVFMVLELAGYGVMSGLLYQSFKLCKTRYGTAVSLVGAMVFGRLVYALALFAAADLLNISKIKPAAVIDAVTAGIIGIVIQIILIPAVIYLLKKSRVIDSFVFQDKSGGVTEDLAAGEKGRADEQNHD